MQFFANGLPNTDDISNIDLFNELNMSKYSLKNYHFSHQDSKLLMNDAQQLGVMKYEIPISQV